MDIKIKRLCEEAVMPFYATEGSAGFDLTAIRKEHIDGAMARFYFGLAFQIPKGYVGLIFPRSSIVNTCHRLGNAVGVIDSDYIGEVSATFDYVFNGRKYKVGERVCQMVIVPFENCNIVEVNELEETERGIGGHGSTGR